MIAQLASALHPWRNLFFLHIFYCTCIYIDFNLTMSLKKNITWKGSTCLCVCCDPWPEHFQHPVNPLSKFIQSQSCIPKRRSLILQFFILLWATNPLVIMVSLSRCWVERSTLQTTSWEGSRSCTTTEWRTPPCQMTTRASSPSCSGSPTCQRLVGCI